MSATRAAVDSGIATAAKLVGAFAAIKIIAIYLGPEGMGLLGQYMSVIAILTVLTNGGISLGITRFVAERNSNRESVTRILQSASWITVFCSFTIGLVTYIGAEYFSQKLFGSTHYALTLKLSCILLLPLGFSGLGLAVINGRSETAALSKIQSGAAIIGIIGIAALVLTFGAQGAAIGLLWMATSTALPIAIWWLRHATLRKTDLCPVYDSIETGLLMRYAWMTIFSVILQGLTQIWIRSNLEDSHGWKAVGYWQAMVRMSDAYLQVFNVFLVAHVLPRLVQQTSRTEAAKTIYSSYKMIGPPLLIVLLIGFMLKDKVIDILLAKNFEPVTQLFLPQMIGDFFKIFAFLPGYLVIARGYVPLFIASDSIQMLMLVGLNSWLVKAYGAVGACWAYALTYFLYCAISVFALIVYKNKSN